MNKFRLFGRFEKVTKNEDGTLVVEGIASSESVDSQGEIVRAEAMRAALPDFMRVGNIREMHQPIAAGRALAMSVGEDGVTRLSAHVVDPTSCLKVTSGVLQGFSIGGTVPAGGRNKDAPNVIESIRLTEISLVDRPANPDALITLVKVDQEPAEPAPAPTEKAASEKPAEASPPAAAEPVSAPAAAPSKPLRKGMWTIQCAAELLSNLAALQRDTAWEAEYEGDASPLPAKLKALATEFAAVLVEMVGEETAEVVADLKEPPPVVDAVAAAATADLQKRATDAETARAEVEKALGAANEALKAVVAERDELAEAIKAANARLATKGVLKAVPVSKAEDTAGKGDAPPPTDTLSLIKAAQSRPLTLRHP